MEFKNIEEIKEKFLIRVFGDTNEALLMEVFNGRLEESKVVELLYVESNPRPYDVLNLARYYKYILNDVDKYMKYVLVSKELGCMDSYSVITWNIINQNKPKDAVDYIENDVNSLGLILTNLPITTIENMIYCGELLGDEEIISKYKQIREIVSEKK